MVDGGGAMAYRELTREQDWLLPPSLEDSLPATHPVRFVAAFVDALEPDDWHALGVGIGPEPRDGAPRYHPRGLLSVWLYGFMTGIRTTRTLEAACRESLPFIWLVGGDRPDHNTLWRFYEQHRDAMRRLFKRTVRTALGAGLIDLALQAVDGTKIAGNAAAGRTLDAAALERLEARLDATIAALEARNAAGDEPRGGALPGELASAEALREKVRTALQQVRAADASAARVNLTDGDARLMKGRQGYVAGYNAQAMVQRTTAAPGSGSGRLITAAEVTTDPDDHRSLVPLLEAAEATLGQRTEQTLADGGYHSGANLEACAARDQVVLMPESQGRRADDPGHKAQFVYDAATDTYTCPEGHTLGFHSTATRAGRAPTRVYAAVGAVCRACPLFGTCTTNRQGRRLEAGPAEQALQAQRARMRTAAAKAVYRHRKTLPETVFGLLKEHHGARRFWLRGLDAVRAEWSCLALGFNLKTLARIWAQRSGRVVEPVLGPAAA
jgi:transposase